MYLEVATNLGVQGLVVFMLFVAALLLLLSRLVKEFDRQILAVETTGPPRRPELIQSRKNHCSDLQVMRQTALAVQGFVVVRLTLGLFGMDLYEIYWWFAMGLAIALYKMEPVARARTKCFSNAGAPDPQTRFAKSLLSQRIPSAGLVSGLRQVRG